MILKALCDYYERAKHAPGAECVAEPGYALLGAGAQIVLDEDGGVFAVSSLREQRGKKLAPRMLIVPQPPKRAGQTPDPAFLYENVAFLFGIHDKPAGAQYRFEASARIHREVLDGVEDAGARALLRFFDRRVPGSTRYEGVDTSAISDPRVFCVFSLRGDPEFLHQRPAIRAAWEWYNARKTESAALAQCLVTGEVAPVARLHGNIAGFGADRPTLVGFNQPAFEFFGKKQGENAPVSERAAFEYVTALNLLCQDRRHCIRLGGDKLVFWAERDAPLEEDTLCALFGGDLESEEPALDAGQCERVRSALACMERGGNPLEQPIDPDVRFFIMGLTSNKTRLVLRFFYQNTFGGILERLMDHYRGLAVAGARYRYPSPLRILLETAVQHKYDNIPPTLESALMRSVLQGTRYPFALYMAVLNRIRAEASTGSAISALRAGILKATLNRQSDREVIKVALDRDERDTAYLLGRLFALYEKAQKEAIEGLNASITDKYFNAVLSAPQTVFPTLFGLNRAHLSKLMKNSPKLGGWLSRQIRAVTEMLALQKDGEDKYAFPPSLDSNGQGKFILGYYHQEQALYVRKDTPAEPEDENIEGGSEDVD